MTKISKTEIQKLGQLARINVPAKMADALASSLSDIIEYVSRLQKIDTEGKVPTSQVTGLIDVWREDEVKPSLSREDLLKNAPATQDGYIKVRRVK